MVCLAHIPMGISFLFKISKQAEVLTCSASKLSYSMWSSPPHSGSLEETETWQPGKLVSNKLNTIITYPAVMNYWTPLIDIDDNEPTTTKEELNMIKSQTPKPTSNKWKRRIEQWQERKRQKEEEQIIIDSGATSHFVSEKLNLPRTGLTDIMVYLPVDSTLKATRTTHLPFEQLSVKARKATILPGLTKSLISVNKMAENGYTTIFRPRDEGVTFHKEGTLTIMTSEPLCSKGARKKERHFGQYQYHKQREKRERKYQMFTTYLPSPKRSNTTMQQRDTQSRTHG